MLPARSGVRLHASQGQGLFIGLFAAIASVGVATADTPPSPRAPRPAIERTLEDLAVYHAPEADDLLHSDALSALLEPAPVHACDDGAATISEVVSEVATGLHQRRIPYRSGNLADCSGIAHRVLRAVAGRCEGVERPSVVTARRAKDLARWYEREERLTRVSSAQDIDDALTVGAVAFFLAPGKRSGGLDNVFHIGVVVDIERDDAGRIQRYAMFHGRRPGFSASITQWHVRDRRPALGNGSERMVAVAWPSDALRPPHLVEDAALVGDAVALEGNGPVLDGLL